MYVHPLHLFPWYNIEHGDCRGMDQHGVLYIGMGYTLSRALHGEKMGENKDIKKRAFYPIKPLTITSYDIPTDYDIIAIYRILSPSHHRLW